MEEFLGRGGDPERVDTAFDKIITDNYGEEVHQRTILQQRQRMYEKRLRSNGVAQRAVETLDVDMALHHHKNTKVFELEIDGVKQGGLVTELGEYGEDAPGYAHYTTLYVRHGEEPLHYDTHQELFTPGEIDEIHGMAQSLTAMADSGQIAPSDDLTSHHNPFLPDNITY